MNPHVLMRNIWQEHRLRALQPDSGLVCFFFLLTNTQSIRQCQHVRYNVNKYIGKINQVSISVGTCTRHFLSRLILEAFIWNDVRKLWRRCPQPLWTHLCHHHVHPLLHCVCIPYISHRKRRLGSSVHPTTTSTATSRRNWTVMETHQEPNGRRRGEESRAGTVSRLPRAHPAGVVMVSNDFRRVCFSFGMYMDMHSTCVHGMYAWLFMFVYLHVNMAYRLGHL